LDRVGDNDLYERNMSEMRRIQEELERKKEQKAQEELKEATFAPHIPETSKVIAKKKLSSNTMGGESSNDVYSRLTTATSPTATFNGIGNESSFTHSTSNYHMNLSSSLTSQQQDQVRRGIILPEKVLSQVFERLATPSVNQMQEHIREAEQQQHNHNNHHEAPNSSTKKIVLPERQVDQIFNRLNHSRTMSFTFKYDDPQHPSHHSNHLVSPTGSASKQPLGTLSEDPMHNNKGKDKSGLQHKDSQLSNVSSLTSASKDHSTPNKRSASTSKITPSRTSASKPVVTATNSSIKRAINSRTPQPKANTASFGFNSLPSPPEKKTIEGGSAATGGNQSSPFPAPPAPPSTVAKSSTNASNNATSQNDYYDDLSKKLEASLHLISQSNNQQPSSTPERHSNNKSSHSHSHSHHKKSDAATDHHQPESGNHSAPVAATEKHDHDNGQIYDLTKTPLPKESEDFINNIPMVPMEENGADED
jgi:hypothetical protein